MVGLEGTLWVIETENGWVGLEGDLLDHRDVEWLGWKGLYGSQRHRMVGLGWKGPYGSQRCRMVGLEGTLWVTEM